MQEIKKSKTTMGVKIEQTLRRDQRVEEKRILAEGRSRKDTSIARDKVTEKTDAGDTIEIEKVNDVDEEEIVKPDDERTIGENKEDDRNGDESRGCLLYTSPSPRDS